MEVEPRPNNMGQKIKRYWEHLEEHIGNLMGTHWEQTETNPKETKRKKKTKLPWAFSFSFGCMKFLFPKELVTIFKLD
jgi:hypothetical protein